MSTNICPKCGHWHGGVGTELGNPCTHYVEVLKAECGCVNEPTIKQQVAELKAAGWIPLTRFCWKAPAGSGCAGVFLGPHGAWKAMKRRKTMEAK
jgi:hypothetical protein